MKNLKKLLALVLSVLTVASCLTGMVFAEGEAEQPDLTCYAEVDYTDYIEDPAGYWGFGSPNTVEMAAPADKGYVTLTSTGGDPYFILNGEAFASQLSAVTSDKLDYVVIKYRTTTIDRGEFYTARTDGVEWAHPMESSHIGYAYKTTGEWSLTVVDASEVWGNVEDVYLKNFRFDFGNKEGSVDVAYIRFYATAEGAQACVDAEQVTWTETVTVAPDDTAITKDADGNAFYGEEMIPLTYVPAEGDQAECYTYEAEKTGVAAPEVPFNPANMDLKVLIDGRNLEGTNAGNTESTIYDYEKGCITFVATGDDPQIIFAANGVEGGPYMVVKYRAGNVTTSDGMECFIGKSEGPQGATDNLQWSFINDGEWHTVVLYLGDLADYDNETHIVNHFRFDYLRGAQTSAGESMDIEYIAFFGDEASATYYAENDVHVLPEIPSHTVTFVADGIEIAIIEFKEGDTELVGVPDVPAKEGYDGAWESYKLGNQNIVVNAVYTEAEIIGTEPTDTEPTETEPTETEPTETEPTETEPTETEPTEETTEEVTEDGKKGCKSAIGMGVVAVMAAAAAVVALKKKED